MSRRDWRAAIIRAIWRWPHHRTTLSLPSAINLIIFFPSSPPFHNFIDDGLFFSSSASLIDIIPLRQRMAQKIEAIWRFNWIVKKFLKNYKTELLIRRFSHSNYVRFEEKSEMLESRSSNRNNENLLINQKLAVYFFGLLHALKIRLNFPKQFSWLLHWICKINWFPLLLLDFLFYLCNFSFQKVFN